MRLTAVLRGACLLTAVAPSLGACDTDAVGVEDCRDIERARCEAALHCDLGIDTAKDVEACKRFVRDNCLHGFAVDESASSTDLRGCVETIQAAGACAEQNAPDVPVRQCEGLDTVGSRHTACAVVETPEISRACEFLVPEPIEEPEEDAGSPPRAPDGGATG